MTYTGMFNVQDYGALGDAQRDDTRSFRQAIAAAEPVGGVVWAPPVARYYLVNTSARNGGPIEVPGGVTLMGNVSRYTGTRIGHTGGPVLFQCTNGRTTRRIQGLVIQAGFGGGIGIKVSASLTMLDQIAFRDWTGATCIDYSDDAQDEPHNCHASNIIIECWDGKAGTIDYGIRCRENWNSSSITNSVITGAKIAGIAVEGCHGSAIRSVTVEHNEAGADSVGILVGPNPKAMPTMLTLDTIYSEGNYSAGIRVQQVDRLVLTGLYDNPNGYRRKAPHSIDISDSSGTGARVRGVTIIGGQFAEAAVSGIRIRGTSNVTGLGVINMPAVPKTGSSRDDA